MTTHPPSLPLDRLEVFATGLDHPESVTWGPDGFVYAGGEAGQIYRIDLGTGEVTELGSTGGFVLGVVTDANANVYSCDMSHRAVFRTTPGGETTLYSRGSAARPMLCPNAAVFAADGTLYVSDSGDWRADNGCIWRIPPGGGEAEVLTGAVSSHSNGLALSPDGDVLYCAESLRPAVVAIRLGADGRPDGAPSTLHVPGPHVIVDGLALDREGGLLLACYSPDSIYRLDGDGLVLLAHDPEREVLASPTNVTFAGPDLGTLVISSLARWHLTKVQVDVVGAPLNYPEVTL